MEFVIVYPNELQHHGVKGMKWGVRKEIDYQKGRVKNVLSYGWRQGHGKNVYSRIQNVKKDSSRMQKMSAGQRKSLSNAEKYWKNRAQGKGIYGSGRRNIIKRSADTYRSQSFNRRAVITGLQASRDLMTSPVSAAMSWGGSLLVDEAVHKIFKHF